MFTKKLKLDSVFIFLFLVLFPFGQIIRIGVVQPIDIVAGLASVYSLITNQKKPAAFKYLSLFLVFALASYIFSIFLFSVREVMYGFLYLIRFASYIYFFNYVWNFVKKEKRNSQLLISSLTIVSVASALIGWIQFFTFPDLKPLFIWNWDMHLFRLAGTFFDPGYLGIILVLGLINSIYRYIELKEKWNLVVIFFLIISLAFTYSRASYLAFFAGFLVLAYYKRFIKKALVIILVFIAIAFALPTSRNHSINLLRSFSAIARLENYKTTLIIFSKSPVFGVGYNNMCLAYNKFIGFQKYSSHACSGSDSSLLFILATTGVLGFIVFLFSIFRISKLLNHNSYIIILTSSFIALLVHSFFSNSVFYPWIMGWSLMLLAASLAKA